MKQIRTNAKPDNKVSEREIAHRKLAREAGGESIVLLKNDGTLPFAPCPIALFGAGAATTIKGGTGSGEVNERYSVTIERGLKHAGYTITTDPYLREYESLLKTEKTKAYKAMARGMLSLDPDDRINFMAKGFQYPSGRQLTDSDVQSGCEVCVYVIARQAGECSDRNLENNDFNLTQTEIDNIKFAASKFKKLIIIINTTGAMDLCPLDDIDGINAILFFCQQGMEGGNALADILSGKVTPSGCLTSTWPFKYEDWACAMEYSYLNGNTDYEEYKEGIFVGYRYFDSFNVRRGGPRYEFGFGLSYTDFSIEYISTKIDKTKVTVTAKVTNTGNKYSGKKVAQLYLSAPSGNLTREYQSLAAFAKAKLLSPGESGEVQLSFDITDFAAYDEKSASFILEDGEYILWLGESSAKKEIISVINLDLTTVTEVCTNICRAEIDFEEIKPPYSFGYEINDDVQRFNINSSDITEKKHDYKIPAPMLSEKTKEVLNKLSPDDMIKVVTATGYYDPNQYFCVPGAAAFTTSHLSHLGVPNAALCDGPAGLRIQRTSVRLKNGTIKPVEPPFEFMEYLPWFIKKIMTGNPKKGELLYQYTSAFPVGTSLAQTWNIEMAEEIGKAFGVEMTEYGAAFLLAPGMNIHRNPLCGRNYEYYSEDPLLTGVMAASFTKGVQSFPGCYVTIKHLAANNQETNRNRCDSRISERALREIYLKGFRIAVEKGNAKSVMTSYNKLNGTYTPNSYDLCTNVLRCEWGFNGVVMTDWSSTEKGLAGNGLAIKAGNDLICPGGGGIIKALKKDLEEGVVSEEEIRLSCGRVLEAVIKSRV